MACRQNISLGEIDYHAIQCEVNNTCSSKRKQYTKFTDADRYDIGQYASENGPVAAVRRFSSKFPSLNESTVRGMRKKYLDQVKRGTESQVIKTKRRGRPLLLGNTLDKKIQEYIQAQRSRGGVISATSVVTAAKTLIKEHPEWNLEHIDIDNSSWVKSICKRMRCKKGLTTTGKLAKPKELHEEISSVVYSIVEKIEDNIPPSMVFN